MRLIDYKDTIQLSPTKEQMKKLEIAFEAYQWVYNYFLELRTREDPTNETRIFPAAAYSRLLTRLRKDIDILGQTGSHVLQSALFRLSTHYSDLYFGKRERILPIEHYTEIGIEVRKPSLSFGDKWVRFPKIGAIRHKHKVNPNFQVYKLVFHRDSFGTYSVDYLCKMEVEE